MWTQLCDHRWNSGAAAGPGVARDRSGRRRNGWRRGPRQWAGHALMQPGGEFDDLLDDPGRLEATDSGGLLRAAATAGAQVRSTAAVAEEAGLGRLAGQRPRALVLLTRPGAAPAAAPLLLALLGPSCPVPVVTTGAVPMWGGALDM